MLALLIKTEPLFVERKQVSEVRFPIASKLALKQRENRGKLKLATWFVLFSSKHPTLARFLSKNEIKRPFSCSRQGSLALTLTPE